MLELSGRGYDELLDRAQEGDPKEVCGVLLSEAKQGSSERSFDGVLVSEANEDVSASDRRERAVNPHRVEHVIPTDNVADDPRTTYRIDPEELFEIVETAEAAGREVVGFYHSHPAGPRGPSPTDIERATWTDHVYLIVSLDGTAPFVGAWIWTGDGFEQEVLRIVEQTVGSARGEHDQEHDGENN